MPEHPPEKPPADDLIARLREMCMALPEVEERQSHGEPAWFVGKKQFVFFVNRHHDDRIGFWCAAPPGAQEVLVGADPQHFFRPPYVGHRGWLGVYLDVDGVDWLHLEDIVRDSYRAVAPARLAAAV